MSNARDLLESVRSRAEEVTLKNRAMDEAPMGITIADMTEDDEPLIYANEGFERLTGYSAEETVGRNCRFLQGEATDPEKVSQLRAALENHECVQVELRNYRKEGTMFWNEVTLAPIFDGDDVPYYVGFQQDVTLRKGYETELESQRDDLDVLNQIVRHDIRNDLQIVLAALEIIEETGDERTRDHVERALKSTRQAIDLTSTAREMSEVMLRGDDEYEPIDLRETLLQEIDQVRSAYPDAEIEIHGTVPAIDLRADAMLSSVFRNLLTNAVQHNDKEEPRVRVTASQTEHRVQVTVEDNGPGVPEALRDEVFGKGVKGEQSRTTGLGLYLVRRLVDNYGGDVWIDEVDPTGTAVTVELYQYD